MRVLFVNWFDWTHPLWGGAEVYLHETARRLALRGHDVTILCSSYAGGLENQIIDGVHIVRRGQFWTFHLEVAWHYHKLRRAGRWDAVVEYTNKVPMFSPLWSRDPVVAVAHHLWGASIFRESWWPVASYVFLMERMLIFGYSHVPWIAVSESTRLELSQLGIKSERISVVPNGIDVVSDQHGDGGMESTNRGARVIWIGRMRRYKCVDVLLHAMVLVRQSVPDATLDLVGQGQEASALRLLATRLGLGPEAVRFHGAVDEATKRALLCRSSVLAQPSLKEGWGRTVLEAALVGVPAVASRVSGLRESVQDGQSGLLVEPRDATALANGLITLLSNNALQTKMGANARIFAQQFSWDHSTDLLLVAIQNVDQGR